DVEKKKEKAELTWLVLYYASRDFEEGDSKRIVAPLYLHFADRKSSWTLMPFYWGEDGPDYDRRILFPLWWSFRKDPDRLRAFFPPPASPLRLDGDFPGLLEVRVGGPSRASDPAIFLDSRARYRYADDRLRAALDLRPQ